MAEHRQYSSDARLHITADEVWAAIRKLHANFRYETGLGYVSQGVYISVALMKSGIWF